MGTSKAAMSFVRASVVWASLPGAAGCGGEARISQLGVVDPMAPADAGASTGGRGTGGRGSGGRAIGGSAGAVNTGGTVSTGGRVSAGGTVNAGGATHPASGGQSSTDAAAPRTDAQVDASQDVAIDAKRPCVGQVPCCGDGVLDGPGGPRNLVVNGDFETGDITGWVLMIGGAVEQGIVAAPLEVQPTLTGFVYRIRPGREYFNAGIAQNLILDVGQSYSFTVAVGSRELQHVGGRRASFEIWIDGTTQATVTHLDSEAPTQELLTGAFVATKQHTEARLVFNRENLSATANPEWTADRVSVVAGTEQCDDGVNDGLVCNPDCTLP